MVLKYTKIIDNTTGLCEVGVGTNSKFYQSIGMVELDVQKSDIDGCWYLKDKCPMKTDEEKKQELIEKRNHEIEQKISELEKMAVSEILEGNKDNVNTYNQVIISLRENLVMGY